ncbi:MAG TPA: dCTP deaminase [Caulobacteraceae bacterium]|jgi:dCTP deaminase
MLSAKDVLDALQRDVTDSTKLSIVPAPDGATLIARGATSIDLRLGRWFRTFKQTQYESDSLISPVPVDGGLTRTKLHFVPFGGKFVLHPGRFVLGATLEWLRLPGCLSGYVTGKSSLGRHGLVIEAAAGLHPKFSGCLTLELSNVGETPLEIAPGMQICQIFLHNTTDVGAEDSGKFSGQRKPMLSSPRSDPIFDRLRDPIDH